MAEKGLFPSRVLPWDEGWVGVGVVCANPGNLTWCGCGPPSGKWCFSVVGIAREPSGGAECLGKGSWHRPSAEKMPGVPWWPSGKESACRAGGACSIPRLGRSPGGGKDTPLQSSCLETATDRGAWWVTVCGVVKSRSQLRTEHACLRSLEDLVNPGEIYQAKSSRTARVCFHSHWSSCVQVNLPTGARL